MSENHYKTNRELAVAQTGIMKGAHFDMGMLSVLLVSFFLIVSLAMGADDANKLYQDAKNWVTAKTSGLFVYGILIMIAFVVVLAISPLGRIRLGKDDDTPDFSRWSWFAMLFSAGMGIGLIYWSVAEPLYHTSGNIFMPEGWDLQWDGAWNAATAAGAKAAVAQQAMDVTLFHWGIHAWTVYVVIGMALAYFSYRKGLPLTVRSALYPIIGNNIYGWFGHVIDLVAVFGTIFGVATSLGLGVAQLNAGLNHLFGLEISTSIQLLLIVIITLIATLSAVTGVDKGVKILSELNMYISAVILITFLAFSGFFADLIMDFFKNLGSYAMALPKMSVLADPLAKAGGYEWLPAWTIFYWAWWIAWSPFVGMFIARAFWMTVFGDTALLNEIKGYSDFAFAVGDKTYDSVRDVAINASSSATYALIEALSWGETIKWIASVCVTVLIATYFITSADSGTLVVTTMLSAGSEQPPRGQRIFWGVSIGAVAGMLLYVGGSKALGALQAASITIGLPFVIILLLMCVGLAIALLQEAKNGTIPQRR
ncbi:MAG: choline transporter [Gammaproteobacteria bacterium]|nr:MAG: choline transporter [Gammaproteobacteria bacterium]